MHTTNTSNKNTNMSTTITRKTKLTVAAIVVETTRSENFNAARE